MANKRYPINEATRYVIQATKRLNKARGLNILVLGLEYSDLMGWNFIKAHLYDQTMKTKFDSMLNEFVFNRDEAMTVLDTQAGILNKDLSEREKIILRVAYTIWRDWKSTRNVDVD